MDVVCGRCKAEYEFDDALISERGTTVRCTTCGLQFKVFPPAGVDAPEVWHVRPADQRVEPYSFESLADLQKAIAKGKLRPNDMLQRGDEAPRPLSAIAELEALLRQPRSVPPPAASSEQFPEQSAPERPQSDDDVDEGDSLAPGPLQRATTGTVIGMAAPRRPGNLLPPPPPLDEPETHLGSTVRSPVHDDVAARTESRGAEQAPPGEAAVPGGPAVSDEIEAPDETAASDGIEAPDETARPAHGATDRDSEPDGEPVVPSEYPDEGPEDDWTQQAAGLQPTDDSTEPAIESVLSRTGRYGRSSARPGPSLGPSLRSTLRRSSPPPPADPEHHDPPPLPRSSRPPAPAPPVDPAPEATTTFRASETAVPSSVDGRSSDFGPISSAPGTGRTRGARSGLVVLAVLLGAGAFALVAFKDRLFSADAPTELVADVEDSAEPASVGTEDIERYILEAEREWLRLLMAPDHERESARQDLEEKLVAVDRGFGDLAEDREPQGEQAWLRIHLLRMNGDLETARRLVGKLDRSVARDPYGLAMLDLAEAPQDRPYPLILRRLEEAATGERGDYLARSAYIFALAAAGRVNDALADWQAMGELEGGANAPLYADLGAYLTMMGATGRGLDDEEAAADALDGEDSQEAQSDRDAGAAAEANASEPATDPSPQPIKTAARPEISDQVRAWMRSGDALWGQGDRQGAMAKYKKVVAEIGTSHFLGQRAASRVRQAQSELKNE